jgi:hypothetical protein
VRESATRRAAARSDYVRSKQFKHLRRVLRRKIDGIAERGGETERPA